MQTNQSATQLELDRIVSEVASAWKISYVACSGIIREYLYKAGVVLVPDDQGKIAMTMIPSPVLTAPNLTFPLTEEIAPAPAVVTEQFMEVLTAAVQHIVPVLELVEEVAVTVEEVVVVVEDRPSIPNAPWVTDPAEKTTKSEQIRLMFDQGMSVGKISRELKSNYSYVWAVVDTYKAVMARQKAEGEQAQLQQTS